MEGKGGIMITELNIAEDCEAEVGVKVFEMGGTLPGNGSGALNDMKS